MSRYVALLVITSPVCLNPTLANDDRPTAVPSKTPEEAVARFVAECVTITPGEGDFPATCRLGSTDLVRHELRVRRVTFSNSFRICRYETTQELFQAVAGRNPSRWKGPRNSVENVSYDDAVAFCRALTKRLHESKQIPDDQEVRLPTAEEWEYCCRAGSESRYSFGDQAGDGDGTELLDAYAWHTGNAAGNDPAVGVLRPNPWGLCDVHGYLWEFVADGQCPEMKKDPERRMICGGSWRDPYTHLTSSTYSTVTRGTTNDALGFRCVIARKPDPKKPVKQ